MANRTYKKIRKVGTGIPHDPVEEIRDKVSQLVSFGITHKTIAKLLHIDPEVLRQKYKYELENGTEVAVSLIAGKLFKKAYYDEDLTAIIFYLKTRARWRTEDGNYIREVNEDIKKQMAELRKELDAKNKKEY